MANFVISTHMTKGDVLPFLRFGSALRKRGHDVTLVTHGAFESLALKAGISFCALDAPEEYEEVMKDLYLIEDPLNRPELAAIYHKKYYSHEKFRKEYDILSALCSREDSVLVCKERDGFVAMMVSEKLQIPIITGVLAPSYLTQLQVWEEIGLEYAISLINSFRDEIGLPPVQSWTRWLGGSKKNIAFWHETFDSALPAEKENLPVQTVGFPLADTAEYEAIPESLAEFIRGGEPPILITGGTGKMIRPNFYQVSIEACKLLKRRTILVSNHEELIQTDLPDFIQWHRVLPLASVYPLVGAVIHHGGIGTISGAMVAGIPQLALAADTDRPDNGLRIKNLGIGDYLPPFQWKPEIIAQSLLQTLKPSVYNRCRNLAEIIKKHDTMSTACAVAEAVVGKREYAISSDEIKMEDTSRKQTGREPVVAGSHASLSDNRRAWLAQQLLKRRQADSRPHAGNEVANDYRN